MTDQIAKLEISFDLELGWGSIENNLWRVREKKGVYENFRPIIDHLLARLDELEVPVTWATVGALTQQPKDRDFSHLPDNYRKQIELALSAANSDSFFGADVIEKIASSKIRHQIGCHSYSHLRFNHDNINASTIDRDITLNKSALADYNDNPTSFVFPQNIEGYVEVLIEHGFKTVRLNPFKNQNNKLKQILDRNLSRPPASTIKFINEKLIGKTESIFFNPGNNRSKLTTLTLLRSKAGLNNCVKNNTTFHVWNHPFNFAENPRLLNAFVKFLEHACELRNKGKLAVRLM